MHLLELTKDKAVATVRMNRGKVHAINGPLIDRLREAFQSLEKEPEVRCVVLTGTGSFFSFGFDVPELLGYAQRDFTTFLERFTAGYRYLFSFPKPVIAALNGHTMAGGCMLATACDHRIMISGKPRISLNEIAIGASVLAGSVEMLKHCSGARNAEKIMGSGALFDADEALAMGLVDRSVSPEEFPAAVAADAAEFARRDPAAYRGIKRLIRGPVAEAMAEREASSIRDFVNIWYSENTRRKLEQIQIRG